MRYSLLIFIVLSFIFSCKDSGKTTVKQAVQPKNYATFGTKITPEGAITKDEMAKRYTGLKKGDTVQVRFTSQVNEVCKKKGCWMKVDLGNGKETMVRFKDYGFFVPKNSEEHEVILNGKAFISEISVDELRHFAKDAGKSEDEINAITEPKKTYAFEADGVLMSK